MEGGTMNRVICGMKTLDTRISQKYRFTFSNKVDT